MARAQEDRAATILAIKDIGDALVPRAEHERVWKNAEGRDADLKRQVDELKQAQGNAYGAHDVVLDLRERLDGVERQRLAGQPLCRAMPTGSRNVTFALRSVVVATGPMSM